VTARGKRGLTLSRAAAFLERKEELNHRDTEDTEKTSREDVGG
jgi:hypothetical protein